MASSIKRTYFKPTTDVTDIAYTVPSVSSAILLSAIATPTSGKDKTISLGVAAQGSSDVNWISKDISVVKNSSVNLIPEKLALTTGDKLIVNANTDLMQRIQTASTLPVANPTSIAVNTAGTLIIICGTDGLALSTNGGTTFTKVLAVSPVNTGFNLVEYFNSKFIYFCSETVIYTSTDGTTWTEVSGQTYPTSQVYLNSTRITGLNNGTLYESLDGNTWSSVVTNGYTANLKTMQDININYVYFNNSIGFWACGDNGTLFRCGTTPGANNWTQIPTGVTDNLNGMFFSSATLYIVGDNGRLLIISSTFTDAATVTAYSSSVTQTTENLESITFNGSYWIACGTNGTIITSTSPSTLWTSRTSGTAQTLNSVTFSASNNAIIVGNTGTILYENGTSGATWTARTSGTAANLKDVFYSSGTGYFFVVGTTGTLLISNNTTTWTAKQTNTIQDLNSISQSNITNADILIAGNSGTILTVNSGSINLAVNRISSGTTSDIKSITGSITTGTYAVYVGKRGLFGQTTIESITGTMIPAFNDHEITTGTSTKINSMITFGSTVIAVGDSGVIYTATTSNPTTWTARTSGVAVNLNSVYAGGSVVVAVGDNGTIITSDGTGVTWTVRTSNTANNLYGIGTGPASGFIAVGAGGVIRTGDSTGVTWTTQTNADTANLRAVAYNSGSTNWVAVGDGGRVLLGTTSATTWAVQTSGTANTLRSVAVTSGALFVAVGDSGTIITGVTAGNSWTVRNSGTSDNLYSVLHSTSAFSGLNTISNNILTIAFGANGSTVTSTGAGSINFIYRKLTSASTINAATAFTSAGVLIAGNAGKAYMLSMSFGGFQETFVMRPTDIPSISYTSTFAVAAGPFGTIYTSGSTTATDKWNVLGPASAIENNFKKAIWNGTNWIFIGSAGGVYTQTSNSQTLAPTALLGQSNINLNSGIWTGNAHVLVGEAGAILSSTNSTTTMITVNATSGTTEDLNDITIKSGVAVAVGNTGTIITSSATPWTTWTARTSGTANNLRSIASNGTLNIFIAVGDSGTILTSTDGTTWTARTSGTTKNLYGIFFTTSNVAVAVGARGTILYSENSGVTWTSVAAVTDYDLLAGTASGTQNYITGKGYTILDATTITAPVIRSSFVPNCTIKACMSNAYNSYKLVYVGTNGMILYSLGRAEQGSILVPRFSGTYYDLNDIISISNSYSAAAGNSGTIIHCASTLSYTPWSWTTSNTTQNLRGIGYNTTGTKAVAVGENGTIVHGVLNGTLNNSYTVATTPATTANLNAVSNASATVVTAVGENGTIVTAAIADMATWTARSSGTTNNLNSVVYNGTNFAAVGNNGIIVYAVAAGSSWTVATSGTTQNLLKVSNNHRSGSIFAAVGNSGTYLSSADGITWTSRASGTTRNITVIGFTQTGVIPSYIDSYGSIYTKTAYNVATYNLTVPKLTMAKLTNANNVLVAYEEPRGTTTYSVALGLSNKTLSTPVSATSETAITDIVSVGDSNSDLFFISQTSGSTKYTTNYITLSTIPSTGKTSKLIGNRIITGTDAVFNLPQATAVSSLATANPILLGPTLDYTNNFKRYSNTVIGFDSSSNLWKTDDITSNITRSGLQVVLSTTEIA